MSLKQVIDPKWKEDETIKKVINEEKYREMFKGAELFKYSENRGNTYKSLKYTVTCQGEDLGWEEYILAINDGFENKVCWFRKKVV
jgi:hypothetical protein